MNEAEYFRRLNVPVAFAEREGQAPLEKSDLDELVAESGGPLLFVNISNRNFKNAARGFDPSRPPSDAEVLDRIEKYWQLRKNYDELWSKSPELFPRTLIGLFGPPDAKVAIGAVKIELDSEGRWKCSRENFFAQGLMQVPVRRSDNGSMHWNFGAERSPRRRQVCCLRASGNSSSMSIRRNGRRSWAVGSRGYEHGSEH